jgi:hypothetical protein
MSTKTKRRVLFSIATAAMSAIGLLACPSPSQAAPCNQWNFVGKTRFIQSNGWTMEFDSAGPMAQGRASARSVGLVPGSMSGIVAGRIDRYAVNLQVNWDGGSLGKDEGSVDANGFAHGVTYDAAHPESHATWNSESALGCNIAGRLG